MKRRADSLEAKLTPEQRKTLLDMLAGDAVSYEVALEWCEAKGVDTSRSAVARFYATNAFAYRLDLAKEAAEASAGLLPEEAEEATRRLVAQKVFEIVARADADPRAVLKVREQELKAANLKLLERRVVVAEKKLAEAAETVGDSKLTPEERDQKLKAIFGLA